MWREGQARRLGQPTYCVFTDKTLLAIAEATREPKRSCRASLVSWPGSSAVSAPMYWLSAQVRSRLRTRKRDVVKRRETRRKNSLRARSACT
ncbi:HRDC domain-containing protein [Streptomyces sp. M19]